VVAAKKKKKTPKNSSQIEVTGDAGLAGPIPMTGRHCAKLGDVLTRPALAAISPREKG